MMLKYLYKKEISEEECLLQLQSQLPIYRDNLNPQKEQMEKNDSYILSIFID